MKSKCSHVPIGYSKDTLSFCTKFLSSNFHPKCLKTTEKHLKMLLIACKLENNFGTTYVFCTIIQGTLGHIRLNRFHLRYRNHQCPGSFRIDHCISVHTFLAHMLVKYKLSVKLSFQTVFTLVGESITTSTVYNFFTGRGCGKVL